MTASPHYPPDRQEAQRMGHDSERAAMIYQHEARGADQLITSAIDAHVRRQHHGDGEAAG